MIDETNFSNQALIIILALLATLGFRTFFLIKRIQDGKMVQNQIPKKHEKVLWLVIAATLIILILERQFLHILSPNLYYLIILGIIALITILAYAKNKSRK